MRRFAPLLGSLLFLLAGLGLLDRVQGAPRLVAELEFPSQVQALAPHPDGRRFAAGHAGGFSLCDRDGRVLGSRELPYTNELLFQADGLALFVGSTRAAMILDASTLEPRTRFPGFAGCAGMSADGRVVVTAHNMLDDDMRPDTTSLTCFRDGKEFWRFDRPGAVTRLTLSPNGRYVCARWWPTEPEWALFDLQTREQLARRGTGFVAFAADGRRMVQQAHTKQLVMLDLDRRRSVAGPVDTGTCGPVAFGPGDRQLLTSAAFPQAEQARTWEGVGLAPLARLDLGESGGSAWLAGEVLTFAHRGAARVWDPSTGRIVVEGLAGPAPQVATGGPGWAALAGAAGDRGRVSLWTW